MATPARQLSTKEADIQMMLAAEVHLGTKNCDFQMERYVFKRRNDGILSHFSLCFCIYISCMPFQLYSGFTVLLLRSELSICC